MKTTEQRTSEQLVFLGDIIVQLQDWQDAFEANIMPMHPDDGDGSHDSYTEYDEAYNCHLEDLHDMVRTFIGRSL